MWNIPNILTLLRIVLIPVFVLLFFLPVEWARLSCALVFSIAAVTDWFDGYLARRWGQVSPFGAFLDPVADKLMVAVSLLLLVTSEPTPAFAIPAAIIIGREITISALREWMAELGARTMVAVSMIGKFKTAVQMIAILLLIYKEPLWNIPIYTVGFVLLYIAAILTLWSMVIYIRGALPSLLGERQLSGSLERK
jgi:CDP-diacylglycerol--glycerol-3-phosphate 3-phosphatidyltransferase/cardiolipin synthase